MPVRSHDPAVPRAAAHGERGASGTHSAGSSYNEPINILIVDDEPKNLTVLETVLDDPAYRIVRAESADQALLALVVDEFALLILDVRLPDMTGFELAQMIKTRRKTARVPIIFLTAYYNEDQHMLEGYDTGAVDYLHKPLNPAVLRSKVAVFAELHRRNREVVVANRALLAEVRARRTAEEQLRELNESLERRVAERTDVLMRTRLALDQTGERYRSLFEGSLDAIFSIDGEGYFDTVNPAASRLLGRSPGELKRLRFLDLCPPDQRDATETAMRDASIMVDTAVITADQERRDLLISGAPLMDHGVVVGTSFIARDITDRKRAEAALQESETRLQLAREAAGFGVWDRDIVAGVVTWSDDQWRLHGLDPRPGGADHEIWLRCVHPDDRERANAEWTAGLAEPARSFPAPSFNIEYRVMHRGGVVRWLQVKGKVTLDGYGRPVRLVGVTADVTTSRETEAALRRLSGELEARVRQEIAAREAAQARAAHAERLQALGQLAGGIAHDFNNVLQALMGALRMIEKRREDVEGFRHLTQLANGAVERGISVTRRLLALSGRGELKSEALDPSAVLRDLQELLTHTLGAGVDIVVRLEPGLHPALADRGQLETVLVNLATNARDAMPDGGQLILSAARDNVSAADKTHPAGLKPGRYVRLQVADTGTGMDAATLDRAREPFFTTKKVGSGTGLGLAMANGFAEQSGGGLNIASEPGAGTLVTLWLPEVAPAGALDHEGSRDMRAAGTTAPAGAARILVVDDEVIIRTLLAKNLEDCGYEVLVAATGLEALAIADTVKLDALVTDLSMPGIDGLGVIRGVQAVQPHTPAVLLTGYAGDETALALRGAMSGTFSLLLKPVTEGQLLDRISTLLSARSEA
jgi:PAS domain S-box-containing protein